MTTDWTVIKSKIESFGVTAFPFEECNIGDVLGHGAAMNVYRGTCRIENQIRHVAFKEHRSMVSSRRLVPKNVEQILNQFRHEIKLMGKLLDHPNIIQIYGVTFKEERPLIVVELADTTLDEYLRERFDNNPMNWIGKTKLCLDVLSGVRGLGEANIIHGDLKGCNILVFINEIGAPRAKISDFGYSLSMSSFQSRTGGTLQFLAPEKTPKHPELSEWRNKPEQDIYGLGMVTFQIATDGKIPYEDTEDAEDIYTAKDNPTFLLEELPPDTPEKYREIIVSTTQVEPDKRASLDIVENLLKMILKDVKENLRYDGVETIPFEDCTIGELRRHRQMLDVYEGAYKINDQDISCAFKVYSTWNRIRIKEKDEFTRNLWEEINQMKKLQYHPNIIQILGVTFNDTMPVLIVELAYAPLNEYLLERRKEGQPVDWFEKTTLCLDVLSGVRGLHKAGIIHGDLNGENVMVFTETQTPRAKLSDFGDSSFIKSPVGTIGGATRFSAPEKCPQHYNKLFQWQNKPDQDIYGLGIVTFQIATDGSKLPYEDADDVITTKIADTDSAFLLGQLLPKIPDEYLKIIEGMTKFQPNKRISLDTAEKLFRDALRKITRAQNNIPTNSNNIKSIVVGDVEDKEATERDIYKASYGECVEPEDAIFSAAERGDKKVVKLLLERGVDRNITYKDKGLGLVHYAAKSERIEVIKMLAEELHMTMKVKDNFGRTPLHYAAKNGNVEVIKYLANETDAEKKAVDNDGWGSLHYAARYGHIDVIKALTNGIGIDINSKDGSGRTAIYLAARQGDIEMILELVTLKADVNIAKWDGWMPIHTASHHGKVDAVQLLLELGANKNKPVGGDLKGYTPLDIALKYDHADVAEVLMTAGGKRGEEVTESGTISEGSKNGENTAIEFLDTYTKSRGIILTPNEHNTPDHQLDEVLFWAAEFGYSDVIRLLTTTYQANIKAKDSAKGLAVIHFAGRNGHTDTVKMLIKEFKVDKDEKNNKGTNVMHYAAKNGHIDTIRMLVDEFKMGIHAKDNIGRTVMHYAAKNGRVEVIQFLAKEPGTDMKAKDKDNWTPLHYAARYRHVNVIKALKNVTDIVNSVDSAGRTATYLAAKYGYEEIIRELVAHNADVNIKKFDGWTPLHTASYHGKLEAVQLLIELGADINTKVTNGDKKWCSPLDIAFIYRYTDVMEVIKRAGGNHGRLKLFLRRR